MSREEFVKIISEYDGEIKEDAFKVKIISDNEITTYYQNGKIAEIKTVPCEISFDKETGGLRGYETTYRLIGGFSTCPPIKEDDVRYYMERYFFRKQKQRQLNFFEML